MDEGQHAAETVVESSAGASAEAVNEQDAGATTPAESNGDGHQSDAAPSEAPATVTGGESVPAPVEA